jgi:hypothetical protein
MRRIVICGLSGPTTYFHIISLTAQFSGKKISFNVKYLLRFLYNLSETSHFTKNSARYYHTCTQILRYGTRYSCRTQIKLEFSRHIFEKYSYIKFHVNPSSGSRSCPMRTDRQIQTGRSKQSLSEILRTRLTRGWRFHFSSDNTSTF